MNVDYIQDHANRYTAANADRNRSLAVDSLWRIASHLDWDISPDGSLSEPQIYGVLNYLVDNGYLSAR